MRLMIVDDGFYIVEYLKHLLDWKKLGIDHIETSTNSIEAKKILELNEIDILITDIRMPEVSGIDLLQHINDKMLKTKVVFLSGYSQFDYAQKAVRLGALDYLLKPVDKDDMEKAMEKAMNQVMKSIDEKNPKPSFASEKFDGLGYLLSVLGEHQPACNDYSTYDSALRNETFRFFHISGTEVRDELTLRDLSGGLESFIWATPSAITGVILTSSTRKLESSINNITFSETFELTQKNTVRHNFHKFFMNENISTSDLTILREDTFFSKFDSGEWEQTRKNILNKFAQLLSKKQKTVYLLELIHLLYSTNNKLQQDEVAVWVFNELSDPDAALQTILLNVTHLDRKTNFTDNNIVHTVQAYIDDHLSDCLSLDDLGKVVHLHPVYLSKFYKQETGENLSGYISMKRLEKASRLLMNSNLHVVDISHLVGYKKPQYFIKLFKDQYGITPYQYRRKKLK